MKILPEQRQKMIEGLKRYWKNNELARDRSRQLMVKYCAPNSHTIEANRHRTESRKGYRHSPETISKIRDSQRGRSFTPEHRKALCVPKERSGSLGIKRSDITKKKLSEITTQQWKNGIHIPTYKSKGQKEVAQILRDDGFIIKEEYFINGKPYDVFLPSLNMVIEFNGTFWHRDPRIYIIPDEMCLKIWKHDSDKLKTAKNQGYDVRVVWQKDWESSKDKKQLLESIINGT